MSMKLYVGNLPFSTTNQDLNDIFGEIGSVEPGKAADLVTIDAPDVDHWLYNLRANACVGVLVGGREMTP